MSASDDYAALLALASTVVPTYKPKKAPADAVELAILYGDGGTPTAFQRRIDGHNRRRTTTHRLVCCSNTEAGARTIARLMADAIDGTPHDRSPWLVTYVSRPIEDTRDQSRIGWSSTVEITHHTSRS